jgi:2-hydroxy-palmitic acid dioxygenase Mpo1-like
MAVDRRLTGGALMPSLAHYMAQYDHEHESGWNKFFHGVGIPMIFAGMLLLIFMKWIWGAGFFLGGWVLLSRPPDRRKQTGVFPGTDLFAGWANLGCKRSMDVPNGHAPQADLGRYSAK